MSKMTVIRERLKLTALASALLVGLLSYTSVLAADEEKLSEEDLRNEVKANDGLANSPLNITTKVSPLVMLVMSREHHIFAEAYPDYTDIDGDGKLDIMYDPSISYEGLFESNLCYQYKNSSTTNGSMELWVPVATATTKTKSLEMWNKQERTVNVCLGADDWSGNFLNYVTTSRIDAIKRVLYGGTRLYNDKAPIKTSKPSRYTTNGEKATILKHSHVLRDAHAWGKVLGDYMYDDGNFFVSDFAGLPKTEDKTSAYFFVMASYDNDRWSSNFMRYGKVENAGMPGVDSTKAQNFIWDWASLQSSGETSEYGIASPNVRTQNDSSKFLISSNNGKAYEANIIVATCTSQYHSLNHCMEYKDEDGNVYYQPYGVLQKYNDSMEFGLISGSWANNIKGAALRANVGSLKSEIIEKSSAEQVKANIYPGDFDFTKSCDGGKCHGIIASLDHFDIRGKTSGDYGAVYEGYNDDGCSRGVGTLDRMFSGDSIICRDWGNPISKLLYQTAMYFKGDFSSDIDTDSGTLGLKTDTYENPYNNSKNNIPYCAKPNALLISDENVSFDSESYKKDTKPFDNDTDPIVAKLDEITIPSGFYFVGKVKKSVASYYDYIPSLKQISKLSDVVGIAPTAAYSFGSYNVAGVAYMYSSNEVVEAEDKKNNSGKSESHKLKTYVVAMKPNMPEIKINVGGNAYVTIIPFAKTVEFATGDHDIDYVSRNRSTNQVADFYVEKLTDNEGVFRINYEDMQYGSDYDMDAVVSYKYKVLKTNTDANAKDETFVRVELANVDGDGFAEQHFGYVITGVEHSGAYIDLAKTLREDYNGKGFTTIEIDNVFNDYHFIYCNKDGNKNESQLASECGGNTTKITSQTYSEQIDANILSYYNSLMSSNLGKEYYYKPRFELSSDNAKNHALIGDCTRDKNKLCFTEENQANTAATKAEKAKNAREFNHTTSRVFKVDSNMSSDAWLKSPLWYAAKYGLDDAQRNSKPEAEPSNYFLASNPSKLRTGIVSMLDQIGSVKHSASSFSTERKSTTEEDHAYATMYNPSGWWGDVVSAYIDNAKNNENKDNEGGYNYSSFSKSWSLRGAFEAYSGSAKKNENAPENRLIITTDMTDGSLVRLYASAESALNKENVDAAGNALDVMGDHISIAKAIVGGESYNSADGKIFLNRFVRWLAGEHLYEADETVDFNTDPRELVLELNHKAPLRLRVDGTETFTLGDIINADVKVFDDAVKNSPNKGSRILVVGANDGMIHISKINVGDDGKSESNVEPIVSYVPTPALKNIAKLADQKYDHLYFVDSTPQVYKDNENVIVYGTYGLGMKGGYALNVMGIGSLDISGENAKNSIKSLQDKKFVKWELTDSVKYAGKMREAPVLAYTHTTSLATPYLIFSSGYEANTSGIFIVDLLADTNNDSKCYSDVFTGGKVTTKAPCIVSRIPLHQVNESEVYSDKPSLSDKDPWGADRSNVPTRVTLVDLDSNLNYQAFYWADNFGYVWKVDLNNEKVRSDIKCWGGFGECGTGNNIKPQLIFKAIDRNNRSQMITVRPAVGFHKGGGIGLIIGTGSFWQKIDGEEVSKKYNAAQSVYMIRDLSPEEKVNASQYDIRRCDENDNSFGDEYKCLLPRYAQAAKDENGKQTRNFVEDNRNYDFRFNINYGWYLDLEPNVDGKIQKGTGERVYRNPIIFGDSVYIVTNVPDVANVCEGGGKSYVLQGSLWNGKFAQPLANDALAGDPVLNVYTDYDGNVKTILQVPLDKSNNTNPINTVPFQTSDPSVRSSSWMKLF